jgi:hypothetical protein
MEWSKRHGSFEFIQHFRRDSLMLAQAGPTMDNAVAYGLRQRG